MISTLDDREDKGMSNTMKTHIIPIERASENLINYMIAAGILYIGDDNQIHCVDENYARND